MRTKQFLTAGMALLFAGAAFADLSVEQRLEDFDYFWETYRDGYVFFELKAEDHGVDWDQVRQQLRTRVANSTSDHELYAAVTEAQTMLQDGHCYNGYFSKIRETEPIFFQRIQFRLVEERKIAVSKVLPGTPYAEAGIEVGDELLKFDGLTIRQLAERQRRMQAASSPGMFWNSLAKQLYIHDPLLGAPGGETATLVFRKPDGEFVEVTSPWNMAPPTGKDPGPAVMAFGPTSTPDDDLQLSDAEQLAAEGPLPMDVRIFRDWNIGYLAIETWMKTEDPLEQMEQVMTELKDTEGLVIDMRGNGGGVGTWGVLFTNFFIEPGEKKPNDSWMERLLSKAFFRASFQQLTEEQLEEVWHDPASMHYVLTKVFGLDLTLEQVQTQYFEGGEFQPFYLTMGLCDQTSSLPVYDKPVYVLTDGGCYSTTDIFLTILDEFERIEIVGTPNGAGSGSPIPFTLPNSGLTMYVPHARAYPPYGSMIEGRPCQPTIPAAQTMDDLRAGRDTTLVTAVKALWKKLNPFSVMSAGFELGESEQLLDTTKDRPIDWGNIPTPDWAIDAKIRALELRQLDLTK